jgi:hypothetical protein
MRNFVISVLIIGLLSLLPLSPRVGLSSGLLPVSISVGQDEANAYVTYRRARVTYRRAIGAAIAAPITAARTIARTPTVTIGACIGASCAAIEIGGTRADGARYLSGPNLPSVPPTEHNAGAGTPSPCAAGFPVGARVKVGVSCRQLTTKARVPETPQPLRQLVGGIFLCSPPEHGRSFEHSP